jgi:hypothetical protein
MRLKIAASSILAATWLLFFSASRADAYVGITAGSLITQLSFASFLLILVSARAIVLTIFKAFVHQVKELNRSFWLAVGKCRNLIGFPE